MLKRLLSLVLCVALFTFVCGCSRPEDVLADGISVTDNEDTRTVTLDAYNVTIDFPKEWYVDMKDATVDLFCSNGPEYMGLYGFSADEIGEDTSFIQMWKQQNETALESYKNPVKLNHTPNFEADDKEFETAVYSVEIEGIKQYLYYVYVCDKEKEDVFLWLSFGGSPSAVRDSFDEFENIADSVKFN